MTLVATAFLALLGTGTHTVRTGETLSGIAAHYGTSADAVARLNGLADPNRILAGDQLTVPDDAATPPTTTYRVGSGDTLGAIARRFGTTLASLVATNHIDNPNLIRIGDVLTVPDTSGDEAPVTGSVGVPPGTPATHVVSSGETIAGIAARYGITQAQLVAANGLADGKIYTGQRLFLSPPNVTPEPAGASREVTVERGQTLWQLARAHGTTVGAIVDANGISSPDHVLAGTTLTIPSGASGGMRCPVPGARFMNDWGFPRSGGRFHEGNDLFAPRGTPIHAPVAGTLEQVTGRIGGKQFKLAGDDGVHYYGTHLDSFGASGRVAAGEVVGSVGDSGNAVGGPPHLHLEVHPGGGAAVNPYPLLLAAC